ncbi:hypothetical protein [Megavirus chiliensis]|uniref:Uncharacterized protein n=1 Tax=Megavirus chiliensis TaxID=1094892 RepID=G5CQB6_9VIRU|nr:hypothetical protein MegaChil _gp0005 [Megavirus chiliensis]AEQ33078.1 hypothetical protein [Megavirus chiliensis]
MNYYLMGKKYECKGDGECFKQTDQENSYIKNIKYKCECELKKCKICNIKHPEWYLNCHAGNCYPCNLRKFINDQKKYANNKKYTNNKKNTTNNKNSMCSYCFGKLVPIGTSRINGKLHEDWNSRKMHKKCWSQWKKETEI